MNITLIKCPWWVRYCPPYILAFFATLLRDGDHRVKVFDLNNILYHRLPEKFRRFWDDRDYYSVWEDPSYIEKIAELTNLRDTAEEILAGSPAVVCFTTHTPNTLFSEKLAEKIKERNEKIITVFMGHKCSRAQMAYDFIKKPYIDYVCTGEADIALCRLIDKLEGRTGKGLPECAGFLVKIKDKIKDCGAPPVVKNLNRQPFPDYSDFEEEIKEGAYSQPRRLDILDSRGCVNACYFCYERLYWGKFRTMSDRRIFQQLKHYRKRFPRINYFYFNGLLLNGSLKTLNKFCNNVIESGISMTWAGQAAIRKDMSGKLLRKMKKAGCVWLGYGVESGSDKVLGRMNKNHTVADALDVLKKTKEAGISVQINIMFGYPTETEKDFRQTMEFIKKAAPYIDNVLASQSFCTLEKETYLRKNPEEFGITKGSHHLYWKASGGRNNYAERFRRYEEFCRFALSLGIPEGSGVLSKKPDKWLLLGDYYLYEKKYKQAAECYEKSLKNEEESRVLYEKLAKVYKQLGDGARSGKYNKMSRKREEDLFSEKSGRGFS